MMSIILQARMGATRLPGKVLIKVLNKSLLEYLIERIKHVKTIDKIIIATTKNPEDKKIVSFAKRLKVNVFRGSEDDVLDRYYRAAENFGVETIVRITGDCPLMDPLIVDQMVNFYKRNQAKFDYINNAHPPTFPDGMDVEIFSFKTLKMAWQNAKLQSEREHVTPYIYKHPEIFRLGNVRYKKDVSYLRLTVDNQEDLLLIRSILKLLYKKNKNFGLEDILELEKGHPKLFLINKHIQRNEGYRKSLKQDKLIR